MLSKSTVFPSTRATSAIAVIRCSPMPRRRAFRCTNILAMSGRDAAGCDSAGIILYGTEDLPAAVFRNKQLTHSYAQHHWRRRARMPNALARGNGHMKLTDAPSSTQWIRNIGKPVHEKRGFVGSHASHTYVLDHLLLLSPWEPVSPSPGATR